LAEINLAWHNIKGEDQLKERFRGCFESLHTVNSYNKDHTWTQQQQIGGTLMMTVIETCQRIITSGIDTDYGRWSWIFLRGQRGIRLRVVTMYRPVHSTGALSSYQQQKRHLLDQDIHECPRIQIFIDLGTQLEIWTSNGEKIIVMGDLNEDIRSNSITKFFSDFNMTEPIITRHGHNAPKTFNYGTTPIDGVFISQDVNVLAGGYTPTKWGMSTDHRLIWIDVEMGTLFGQALSKPWAPKARRLKLNDPRIVARFMSARIRLSQQDNILTSLKELQSSIASEGLGRNHIHRLKELDRLCTGHVIEADKQRRKLKMGAVPWSPPLQQSIDRIRYYRACIGRLFYNNINSRMIQKLYIKSKLPQIIVNIEPAVHSLKNEYKTYNTMKNSAKGSRQLFLAGIAQAQASIGNLKVEKVLQQLLHREQQKELSLNMKRIFGTKRAGVTAIEIQTSLGSW
jgi:hypothetical protein